MCVCVCERERERERERVGYTFWELKFYVESKEANGVFQNTAILLTQRGTAVSTCAGSCSKANLLEQDPAHVPTALPLCARSVAVF